MKKPKEPQKKYRVADFENAIEKSDYSIHISLISYMPDSLYVEKLTGFVEFNNREIRVTWNHCGESFVAGERTTEFDLIIKKS